MLADRLNASISVALILLQQSSSSSAP